MVQSLITAAAQGWIQSNQYLPRPVLNTERICESKGWLPLRIVKVLCQYIGCFLSVYGFYEWYTCSYYKHFLFCNYSLLELVKVFFVLFELYLSNLNFLTRFILTFIFGFARVDIDNRSKQKSILKVLAILTQNGIKINYSIVYLQEHNKQTQIDPYNMIKHDHIQAI